MDINEKRSIYSIQNFKVSFLEKGVSYFNNEIVLFDNDEVFVEFENRIIKGYDSSSNNNLDKYSNQLKNSSIKFRHFLPILFGYIIFLSMKSYG